MDKRRLRWREMLPIVSRELRVASKRRITHRLRWVVALLGGVAVFGVTFAAQYSQEAGQVLFWSLSTLMAIICAAAGLVLTADSISREKREGTLWLLFLTRLTSIDVVLGKLSAGVLTGGSVAFAGLPFLAFSLCLGGVTAREFFVMSAALLFLLACSLTLGIFVSAMFRREGVVALVFCLMMIGPMAVTPLALMKWNAIPLWLARVNPFLPALSLCDAFAIYFTPGLATSALKFQSFAIVAMLLAAFIVLPFAVDAPVRSRRWRLAWVATRRVQAIRFDKDPVYALSRKYGSAIAVVLVAAGIYLGIRIAASSEAQADLAVTVLLAFLPKFVALWNASGAMAGERRSGFLESLLTTPLTSGEVLRGKMAAVKVQVAPVAAGSIIGLWAIAMKWWGNAGEIGVGTTLIFAAMIALLIDVYAIGWVGMFLGLAARDRRRALIGSALIGMVLPCLPAAIGLPTLAWMLDSPTWFNEPKDVVPIAMISVNVVSFGIACFAMARVHDKFRSTATQTWAARGRAALP